MIPRLRAILDRAAERGAEIPFWWRDDDVVTATPALDRLLALGRKFGVPIALAAIPAGLQPTLPARLRQEPGARILVHGLAHRNHAAPGRKSAEFGADRPEDVLREEASAGLAMARAKAGELLLPVLVPPWNRIAPGLAEGLPALGYRGLSTYGPRRTLRGVTILNTHLDPVDWRGSRSALPLERLLDSLETALASAEPEPIGLLTHHLMFDEPLWAATQALVEALADHPAVRFPPLDKLWADELRD